MTLNLEAGSQMAGDARDWLRPQASGSREVQQNDDHGDRSRCLAGLNHLALITNDMDTTVRFWHGVMGAPLVATIGTPTFRHYFFAFGSGNSVAFFEYTGQHSDMIAKPAGVFDAARRPVRPPVDGPAR